MARAGVPAGMGGIRIRRPPARTLFQAVSVVAPMLEAACLTLFGARDGIALAPQLTALPPFDLFHDLRWISVYHRSWLLLGIELTGMVTIRALWTAWIVRVLWPRSDPPRMGRAAARLVVYEAVAAGLLVPWVALLFGLALTHLSFLFFAALPPAIGIAVAVHRGAISRAAGIYHRWGPTRVSLAWILGSFLWLTVAGGIASSAPVGVAVAVSGLAGLANARAWSRIVEDFAGRTHRVPVRWMASSLVAATFVVVLVGTSVGFAADRSVDLPAGGGTARPGTVARSKPVLVAGGLFSRLTPSSIGQGLSLPGGFAERPFSYRGLGAGDGPLPYGPGATLAGPEVTSRLMAEQVRALYGTFHQPVTIVAESEGALVARTYLLTRYPRGSGMVDRLITLGLAAGPTAVYFPPPGAEGWGVGSGWALRGLAGVLRQLGPLDLTPDAPLLRELTDCSGRFRAIVNDPLPDGIEQVSFGALADSVDPTGASLLGPQWIVAAAHGGLLGRPEVQRVIAELLQHRPVPEGSRLDRTASNVVSAASAPWRVPSLVRALTPTGVCSTVP